MSLIKVPYLDASAPQLRYFAGTILGLEVAKTENGGSMRSKIDLARPGLTEIEVPEELVEKYAPAPAAVAASPDASAKAKDLIPTGRAGQHFAHDLKVELTVATTSDKTKPKDVQVAVNGDAIIIKRGEKVRIPYRHYLALTQAVESVARDTDEINPATGMPRKEWVDELSYPFTAWSLPSGAEIAAWEKRTAAIVMQ